MWERAGEGGGGDGGGDGRGDRKEGMWRRQGKDREGMGEEEMGWDGEEEFGEEMGRKVKEEEGGKKEGRCHPKNPVHSCVLRFFPKAHSFQCRRNG